MYDLRDLAHLHTFEQTFEPNPLGIEVCPQFVAVDGFLIAADRDVGAVFTIWDLASGVLLGALRCSSATTWTVDAAGSASIECDVPLGWGQGELAVPEIISGLSLASDGTHLVATTSQVRR